MTTEISISKLISILLGVFFALNYGVSSVLASPPATQYAPGETLEPACPPGGANCSVYMPLPTTLTSPTTISMSSHPLYLYGGNLFVGDGSTSSTLQKNILSIGQDAAHDLGRFYVDSSGNISSSGTLTLNGAGGALNWDNTNGRLGINGVPTRPLQIYSSVADSVQVNRVNDITTGDTIGVFSMQDKYGIAQGQFRVILTDAVTNSTDMRLGLYDASDNQTNPKMTVKSNGRVGIGTNNINPATALHVLNTTPYLRLDDTTVYTTQHESDNLTSGGIQFFHNQNPTYYTSITPVFDQADSSFSRSQGLAFNVSNADSPNYELMRLSGTGYVGIGTTDPKTKLAVNGQFSATNGFSSYTDDGLFSANAAPSYITTPGGKTLLFGYSDLGAGQYVPRIGFYAPYEGAPGNQALTKASIGIEPVSGDFTIRGGASNTEQLRILNSSGQLQTTGGVRFSTFGAGSLQTDANGNLSVSSDERLKNIQRQFGPSLEKLLKLSGVVFKWNEKSGLDMEHDYVGFIAQDVEKQFPELVGVSPNGYKSLNYASLTVPIVEAIKELQAQIDALKTGNCQLPMISQSPIANDQNVIFTVPDVAPTIPELTQTVEQTNAEAVTSTTPAPEQAPSVPVTETLPAEAQPPVQ